jgi:hypothetical protein
LGSFPLWIEPGPILWRFGAVWLDLDLAHGGSSAQLGFSGMISSEGIRFGGFLM